MREASQLVKDDPWLEPYAFEIDGRMQRFKHRLRDLENEYGSLESFAAGYKYLGFNFDKTQNGWWYREWAPAAEALFLTGDFNQWNRGSHPLRKIAHDVWEIFVPASEIQENSRVKVFVVANSQGRDRLPAYINLVAQNHENKDFCGILRNTDDGFEWTDRNFDLQPVHAAPLIYEAHVGLAQEYEGIGQYREFTDYVLPKIKALGYNALQLMAIQEHPYYGSFGYHVSNFFAPSSRFGAPEDLKQLINTAHEMDIAVIIDLVHSHAAKNIAEGINEFDGSDDQYFHPGGRGYHSLWDSKLFNYGKKEVLQFLLSNIKYWIKEFHVDGFRFDGITSMMYFHHGDFTQFDHYDKYFLHGVDWDALTYLQLANTLAHRLKKHAINIAEDMSGMPGLCRGVEEGGLGFDLRLGMGIPDFWIRYLKEKKDEDWDIHEMWSVMCNRRWKERTVAYAESHDQAIVGDKTIAFWLMDKEMYHHMRVFDDNLVVERGIALHKMIRLFTSALGGEAYLNFIGNEFGHPEWIDFPREGNNWSYKYARRQWSLVENENLRYKFLSDFDKAMLKMLKDNNVLSSYPGRQINMDAQNKTIIFERANLIFAFNFHTHHAIPDYKFPSIGKGAYRIILNSDAAAFGGHGRVDDSLEYRTVEEDKLSVYLPNRTALVFKKLP